MLIETEFTYEGPNKEKLFIYAWAIEISPVDPKVGITSPNIEKFLCVISDESGIPTESAMTEELRREILKHLDEVLAMSGYNNEDY